MGWFDEQIRERKLSDKRMFEDSLAHITDAAMGRRVNFDAGSFSQASTAIEQILKFYGKKCGELPEGIDDFNEALEYLCRPHGIMRRRVNLTEGWYRDAFGAMLGFLEDGHVPVALIPQSMGYAYRSSETDKWIKITKKNCGDLEPYAICFYKPFPLKKLNSADLLKYAVATRSVSDVAKTLIFMGICTLLGLLMPRISHFLYSNVIEEKSLSLLISTIVFYICVSFSNQLFTSFRNMVDERISTKMNMQVQAATMMRILSLPASFFRQFSSGELSQRSQYISSLCGTLVSLVFSTGFTSLFSLAYLGAIFEYAPRLVVPSLIIILVTVAFSVVTTLIQIRISKEQMELGTKLSGITYAMISGIQKIKLAGAEKRAFARWGNLYAKESQYTYNPPTFIKLNAVFSLIISSIGMIVMYYLAVDSGMSMADYNAFNTAYGMIFGTFMSLGNMAMSVARLKPTMEMAKPILDAVPEVSEGKEVVTSVKGTIEINNVSFRYTESQPYIVDDMTLKINSGQYIAIVGKTGCGKSTLVRLLLGFEAPEKGAIYYDGKDMQSLDFKSLRRKIGTVTQDGRLFQGDIFSNITISAPWLTLDDAWEAAEIAGIADDIREMPMGMFTLIAEGAGGISGGQRQRLMIARAVAPKPRILIFDEATSALDNITQKKVSDALDKLNCTRIVIAHRLSTIKHCDRILYLEDGKIKEDGTYDELIAKKGLFFELVERQRVDQNS